jgi:hypothetical protein
MHTLTIQSRFTFGDRVRFNSRQQGCSGTGTIRLITVDERGEVDYTIEPDGEDSWQPGIVEDEITRLTS